MTDVPAPRPAGVVPYLTVRDGAAAIRFCVEGLGATELFRQMAEDGRRVLHASLSLNGGALYLADDFPEFRGGRPGTPDALGGTPVALNLHVPDVDAAMDRAVAAGATVAMPAQDMFWGDRYGQVRDPFGHLWAFAAPIRAPGR